jgi:glycosyltransferase involved in cell wall biosynthesis
MTKLSIIIPCYNCESTLAEAVDSVRAQTSDVPFDLTMVDDGSTDGTYRLMEALASGYPGTKLVRHASNRGGGAARNTAVANCDGEIIFCLDSDDMMGPRFIQNLTQFWLSHPCDGVSIGKSIKFKGTNKDDVEHVHDFSMSAVPIPFESLLDGSLCPLMSTFLITRESFYRIGGYPTSHGFDTQGMAFRFLANGLQAYVCPDAIYYHRLQFHRSYYTREDQAGRFHWNWLQIYTEFLYLFRNEIKAQILDYDVFPTQAPPALEHDLQCEHQRRSIYSDNYHELIHAGRDGVANRLKASSDMYDQYWIGEYWLSKARYAEALRYFTRALESGFRHWTIYGKIVEAALRVSGSDMPITLSMRGLRLYLNDPGRTAESAAPPLRAYQRLENWMFRQRMLAFLGRMLKSLRLLVRSYGRS